jgi:hypothetical protein
MKKAFTQYDDLEPNDLVRKLDHARPRDPRRRWLPAEVLAALWRSLILSRN